MKFALISADKSHKVTFKIHGEQGDSTSFLNWVDVWRGTHLSFETLRSEDNSYLKEFDVVMMSGHPHYIEDLIRIANMLKDSDAISMFWPEGSVQLYDASIDRFDPKYYEAWNACDIVSIAEEDKASYYQSFIRSEAIVRFIHVPLSQEMESGRFLVPWRRKQRYIVVYGDNNPNHPMVAAACAEKLKLPVFGVAIDKGKADGIKQVFPELQVRYATKLSQNLFLRYLGLSVVHFYPTEWIGTARQQIACAVAGTPCIGNHDCHTQRRLYPPELAFDIYDVDGMAAAADALLGQSVENYEKVVREAFEKAQFYNLQNTKNRFLIAVEDARKIKQKVLVPV